MADDLLEHIANGGSVREFCRQPGRPKKSTVYQWGIKDEEFYGRFRRARTFGAADKFEEAMEIARTPMVGEVVTIEEADGKDGDESPPTKRTVRREDMLGHRKLLVETLMKQAACYDPANFGTKQQVEHTGKVTLEQMVMEAVQQKRAEDGPG